MATPILLPKLGNSVETCLINRWKKQVGDSVAQGEIICEVETDKAVMEVESTADGVVLSLLYAEGDEVPVMTPIAVVGEKGESVGDILPETPASSEMTPAPQIDPKPTLSPATQRQQTNAGVFISPRARNLAETKGVPYASINGTGPDGRIIERDVKAVLAQRPPMTRSAQTVADDQYSILSAGSGLGGRITRADLAQPPATTPPQSSSQAVPTTGEFTEILVKGARKVIAQRMLESLQTTAQLTLNSSVDVRAILAYRKRLKATDASLGLNGVTINDVLLFAVSRILPQFADMNALFYGDVIHQYQAVHLGFAVDTPRGLLVPVIRNTNLLTLKKLADEAHRLADACLNGKIMPDELQGGTFSVSNLGSLGIESFTPVLNPPQVGILGVGNVNLKPMQVGDAVEFIPHINLSLTINHQVVDGAPGARFLQALSAGLQDVDLLLAM